ncbi:MAG: bifunctional homocysteine S-methyltransferase/methylenetetrahydrofolate reductase [Oscillospiraceae bacterium]|jgi:homocysteine S-methyltransferase|nr:bifunctional homocysteine S-methyltransferase/methylenetetrahydrofolate reductase [Oscillospiraceae bacterium]
MTIREYLKQNRLLCDGAFGTYFSQIHPELPIAEKLNFEKPEFVKAVSANYIKGGAKLVRANTFAANRARLQCGWDELTDTIRQAYSLAKEAAAESGGEIFVAGEVGPVIYSKNAISGVTREYETIGRTFIEEGAEIIFFETLSEYDSLLPALKNLKKLKDVFIIAMFSLNRYGYTDTGISAKKILQNLKDFDEIDAAGFNCGIGPQHLYQTMRRLNLNIGKYICAFPNSGYPELVQNRMVFMENSNYYAESMRDIVGLGVDILGGCCGTDPNYIRKMAAKIPMEPALVKSDGESRRGFVSLAGAPKPFFEKEDKSQKIIAVELDPPVGSDTASIMDSANLLKNCGADVITFADSPSGRTRADSILMSVKAAHEVGITVMPHICCRDKNAIAMRSQILGAYMNGIRDFLIITGDPVPRALKNIKNVFNYNSISLMKMVSEMNEEQFGGDRVRFGGAINYHRRNISVEAERVRKKIEAGAEFFLTQPLFADEDIISINYIKNQSKALILCGIMPLVSYKNAQFIQNEITGINVPEAVIARFAPDMTRREGESVGLDIALEVIRNTYDFADGYYFIMPFNRAYLLREILRDIRSKNQQTEISF